MRRYTLAILAAVCALIPAAAVTESWASSPDPPRQDVHSCGSHVLSGHNWTSHIDGVAHEQGTHWLVYWAGGHGSCAFAEQKLAALLKFGAAFLEQAHQAPSPNRYAGGTCRWTTRAGEGHESITPFQEIRCSLPIRLRGHRFSTTIGALIDPDPRFIAQARARAALPAARAAIGGGEA
jgi:hypothetical protein